MQKITLYLIFLISSLIPSILFGAEGNESILFFPDKVDLSDNTFHKSFKRLYPLDDKRVAVIHKDRYQEVEHLEKNINDLENQLKEYYSLIQKNNENYLSLKNDIALLEKRLNQSMIDQSSFFKKEIIQLEEEINLREQSQKDLLDSSINQLNNFIIENHEVVQGSYSNLSRDIDTLKDITNMIDNTLTSNYEAVGELDDSLDKVIYFSIFIFILIILISLFAYFLLKKYIANFEAILGEKIFLEQLINVDESKNEGSGPQENKEIDHAFALKIADEITRFTNNLNRLECDERRLKPLLRGIERVEANFLANGYEVRQLLGENYDERMIVDVISFIDSEELPEGSKIISKVIRPQVLYEGKVIQRAQVEVTQN